VNNSSASDQDPAAIGNLEWNAKEVTSGQRDTQAT